MDRLKVLAATIAAVFVVLVLPTTSSAKTKIFPFAGTADADEVTQVTFDVKGVTKKVKSKNGKTKKKFVAKEVSNVHVIDQLFTCYDAAENPVSDGRFTLEYQFPEIPPMKVKPNGKFSGVYQFETGGHVITRETFAGRFKGRKATGTFRAQYDPGGIEFGYCGNKTPEPWTAKG